WGRRPRSAALETSCADVVATGIGDARISPTCARVVLITVDDELAHAAAEGFDAERCHVRCRFDDGARTLSELLANAGQTRERRPSVNGALARRDFVAPRIIDAK